MSPMSAALQACAAAYMAARVANQEALTKASEAKQALVGSEKALIDAILNNDDDEMEDCATAFVHNGHVLMTRENYWDEVPGDQVAIYRIMAAEVAP